MPPGAPASAKYDNMRVYLHQLGSDEARDQPVFGPDLTRDPVLPRYGLIAVHVVPGTKLLLASQVTGVVETPAIIDGAELRQGHDINWIGVHGVHRVATVER